MGRIVDNLKRVIVANGGTCSSNSKAEVVRQFIKQVEGHEIGSQYESVGEIIERYADLEEGSTKVSFSCKISGVAATADSITVKEGSTIGSGEEVDAGTDGKYTCKQGSYNYSVVKDGYTTVTGTFSISASDVASGTKTIDIALVAVPVADPTPQSSDPE